jgi:predicted PurR-regulated permease PerM
MIAAKPAPAGGGRVWLDFLVVLAALHFAEDVLIPVALALLLAFLLAPLVDRLQPGTQSRHGRGAHLDRLVLAATVLAQSRA